MKHVHFIGIGGVGMSGLAQVLLERGIRVSGSDPNANAATERLAAQGATIYSAQTAENIAQERPEMVIATAAIHEDNTELKAAREAGIEVLTRAEFLGRLMAEHAGPRIGVSGTHGKTTTTGMLASALISAGLDPTVLVGGEYAAIGGNVRVGHADAFLTEACEAYDSFLSLRPDITVITNVEADHLDYYGTEERVFESFSRFVGQTSAEGALVWCAADPGARRLVESLGEGVGPHRRVAFGLAPEPGEAVWATDVRHAGGGSAYVAHRRRMDGVEETLGEVRLRVPGQHNVLDSLGALVTALVAGVHFSDAAGALAGFNGVGRRFERLGEVNGALVFDDYAHHPTEIAATVAAAREAFPDRRLVAVFQPHLYSRTRDFMDEFAATLSAADVIVLTDIYAAREQPIEGVRVADMTERIAALAPEKSLLYIADKRALPDTLRDLLHPGDLIITIGAGDIRLAGEALVGRSP